MKFNVGGESRVLAFISQFSLFSESNTRLQGAVQSNRFDLSPVSVATSCKCESKDGFSWGVSNRWIGIWNGTVEWKMEWNYTIIVNSCNWHCSSRLS